MGLKVFLSEIYECDMAVSRLPTVHHYSSFREPCGARSVDIEQTICDRKGEKMDKNE